jgi:Arc/MetJ-type ribon-helix-helix transcriptional regulator
VCQPRRDSASEVVREGLRLLKETDELRRKLREQIELGWLDVQAGRVVDGPTAMGEVWRRLQSLPRKGA